jgi:hypothetical protein
MRMLIIGLFITVVIVGTFVSCSYLSREEDEILQAERQVLDEVEKAAKAERERIEIIENAKRQRE